MKFKRIDQVVGRRLCLGCGACVPACDNQAISLVDIQDQGTRPIVNSARCRECGSCVEVCPGIDISHRPFNDQDPMMRELSPEWGPVLEVWEGYAGDPEIRYCGSSGGAATALALFCLERQNASGVLHIGAKPEAPLENIAVFSRSRTELVTRTGSRYSPAAPCEKLPWIQEAFGPSVFIGKPCDVVALRKSEAVNPSLDGKIHLAISIFCAGTPSTKGTYHILEALGVAPEEARAFRYRGCGWPGATVVTMKGDGGRSRQMSYEESWGNILSKYTQFRCRLCPDSTGEFADVSCGDPWYREIQPDEKGWSLIVVRTEKGRRIVQEARKAGYLELQDADPSILPRSQKALLARRRHLWGRLFAMQMMRVPTPRFAGFSLFRIWLKLPVREKLRSFIGTLKRIIVRGWMKPLKPIVTSDGLHEIRNAEEHIRLNEFGSQCKL